MKISGADTSLLPDSLLEDDRFPMDPPATATAEMETDAVATTADKMRQEVDEDELGEFLIDTFDHVDPLDMIPELTAI